MVENHGAMAPGLCRVRGRSRLFDGRQRRRPIGLRNTAYAREFADSVGLLEATPELETEGAEGDRHRALAGTALNAHVRREFNIPGVTFGGRYDGSPIIVADGSSPPGDKPNEYVPTACPGGRPPHAWLEDGRSLYDSFHFEWTLLSLGPQPPDTDAFEHAAQTSGLDLRVVRHTRREGGCARGGRDIRQRQSGDRAAGGDRRCIGHAGGAA